MKLLLLSRTTRGAGWVRICPSRRIAFNRYERFVHRQTVCRIFSATADQNNQSTWVSDETVSSSTKKTIDEVKWRRKLEEKKKKEAKARRRELLGHGKAKAVDRGLHSHTYKPAGDDGNNFQALSGLPNRTKLFIVLGIESSCDDTGAAVVRSDGVILGEALASQKEIHEVWGGVKPDIARDAHQEEIESVVQEALQKAGMSSADEVDAIGVTVGPGLEICLRVGCNKARQLAMDFQKPFVAVHHLEAHILMSRFPLAAKDPSQLIHLAATTDTHASTRALSFPFLALLVSGGHCQLIRCKGIGNCDILGGTQDDSLGEAFDKTARLLGLPVGGGGGPALEKLALDGNETAIDLPIPLRYRKDMDFSYSGLKTAVRVATEKAVAENNLDGPDQLPKQIKADIAASFQNVAIRHITQRLKYAMDLVEKEGIHTLALVGGVAANSVLRTRLEEMCSSRATPWHMFVPPPRLCTDQGTMIAWASIERIMKGSTDDPSNQEVHARYPFAKISSQEQS